MGVKFLLVRFSAIGDCVMSAWAATSIRHKFPDADLVWAADSRCADVIERDRLVSSVCEFPRDKWKASRWSPATWREQLLRYTSLRRYRFDYGLDLQGHSKTALCLRIAMPRERIAARATDALARRLNPTLTQPEGTHIVDWNHEVLCRFGEFELSDRPIMPPAGGPVDPYKVSFSVGAGHPSKRYPIEKWREVARLLRQEGLNLVALGGPEDRGTDAGPDAENKAGKLSLAETMSEVATSALHLAADTGTGHMAAAYGVPCVSVFGPMDPAKYRPYGPRVTVLRQSPDPGDVPPAAVVAAALDLLRPREEDN